MLRQRAYTQLDRAQLVEVRDELVGSEADEAWGEAALRHECRLSAFRDASHRARHFHVLSEIEVVNAGVSCGFGHGDIAVVREARNDSIDRMRCKMSGEHTGVPGIHGKACEVRRPMGANDCIGSSAVDIREIDLVAAGFSQETGTQRADLAGAENQSTVHWSPRWFKEQHPLKKARILLPRATEMPAHSPGRKSHAFCGRQRSHGPKKRPQAVFSND